MTPIRLLIADDHPFVREGLRVALSYERDLEIVAIASCGEEAVSLYRRHQPDIALFDVRMPDMDGIDALKAVRFEFPGAYVVMYSSSELEEEVAQAMNAGARGFLSKAQCPSEFMAGLRSVAKGDLIYSSHVKRRLANRVQLPPREIQVLDGMARGLSNKEIAGKLHLSPHTIKTYVKGLLSKLNVPDRAGAVAAGYERGVLKVNDH